MKNRKVIVISGFARGGTNIAWNILQSHPDVVAPLSETGQLFKRSARLRFGARCLRLPGSLGAGAVDRLLFRYKMESLAHPDNRFIAEDVPYTSERMANAALCLKSVNEDIDLTETLRAVYPNLYFIFLTRDGYALCNGYVRRGGSPARCGALYSRIAKKVKKLHASLPNFHLLRFEDMLRSPFEVSERLFSFLDLQPAKLPALRLKAKRVMTLSGQHQVSFGGEHSKYWFSPDSIREILRPDVDRVQMERLEPGDRQQFESKARPALEYFGYSQ